jgi:hypothetical protein
MLYQNLLGAGYLASFALGAQPSAPKPVPATHERPALGTVELPGATARQNLPDNSSICLIEPD